LLQATIDDNNLLDTLTYDVYVDNGFAVVQAEALAAPFYIQSCYSGTWVVHPSNVTCDLPINTPCRAPITVQCVAVTEMALEHLATQEGLDPLQFRINNLLTTGDSLVTGGTFQGTNPLPDMIAQLKISCDYDNRVAQVETFNQVEY
jgi:xanthine dehydrogenase molybdopterin-binding subunit B